MMLVVPLLILIETQIVSLDLFSKILPQKPISNSEVNV